MCADSVFPLGLLPWSWEIYSLSILLVQEDSHSAPLRAQPSPYIADLQP